MYAAKWFWTYPQFYEVKDLFARYFNFQISQARFFFLPALVYFAQINSKLHKTLLISFPDPRLTNPVPLPHYYSPA